MADDLLDSCLDAAVVNERASKRGADRDAHIKSEVAKALADERKKQGLAPGEEGTTADAAAAVVEAEPENEFVDQNIIYNSLTGRSVWYHMCGWLWCNCMEPRYKITSTYVIGEEWKCLKYCCCYRVTDSMAYENITDLQRRQNCCYAISSCCCPCFTDMGDVILMGGDDTHAGGWKLRRIHQSKKVTNELIRIIQDTSAVFRKD